VSAETVKPFATNAVAKLSVDFAVQRNGDIGSPRASGETRSSSSITRPGCSSTRCRRPAPGARTRPAVGTTPFSISLRPSITVLRLNPDASVTQVVPPRPKASATAPATNRRCRSSKTGPTSSKNRRRPSTGRSTKPPYNRAPN
jgi:hypothetical protein